MLYKGHFHMAEISFVRRNSEAIVTGLVVAAIVGVGPYLYDKYPTLLSPFMYISVCGASALVSCLAVIMLRRIPKPPEVPTSDNIEEYVREWIDAFGFTVQKDPNDGVFFRYRVTLPPPDNEHITVFRMKNENPQYIHVYADLSMTEAQFRELRSRISDAQILQVLNELKLELARIRMGYSGLTIPPVDFKLFKRVLIHPGLKESDFFAAIGDVEAAMHLVSVIYLRMLADNGLRENPTPMQPESTFYTQARELSPASASYPEKDTDFRGC